MSTRIKVLQRPALVVETPELDAEYRAARWVYNRLLDFEFEHQAILDAAAPRLARVGRLIARLNRRDRWRSRVSPGSWSPRERPELRASLLELRDRLRKERNADPRWRAALDWPREKAGEKTCRRKKGETDEELAARQEKAFRTRREAHTLKVYAESRCYWSTFNAQKASVEAALKSVLTARKAGLPAQMRRPKWRDPGRITASRNGEKVGFEVLEQGPLWWTMRIRLRDGWAKFRAKIGNCPELPDDASIRVVELCRSKQGNIWRYSVSITVDAAWVTTDQGNGVVGIDTGHRRFDDGSIRAWTWYGSDGESGEVRLPPKCRAHIDKAHEIQAELDARFNSMATGHRSRHRYRSHLMRLGVRNEEQHDWLVWETRREIDMKAHRGKARSVRDEIYLQAVRALRRRYRYAGLDITGRSVQRAQSEQMTPHNSRQNRDLVAAFQVKALCDRFGIIDLRPATRKSTAECPGCGQERETGKDLLVWCPACDLSCDQDYGAAYVLMRRAYDVAREQGCNLAE